MTYSLRKIKAKNINVFFDLTGTDMYHMEVEAKRKMLGQTNDLARTLEFILDGNNSSHQEVIKVRKLLIKLIGEAQK